MTRRRRLLLVGLPLLVAATAILCVAAKPKDEFKFLHDLHPRQLKYRETLAAGGSWVPPASKTRAVYREVMVFPQASLSDLELRLRKEFPASTVPTMAVADFGHVIGGGSVTTEVMRMSTWSEPSGRTVFLMSGQNAAEEGRQLTTEPIPAGSCLVITERSVSWAEKLLTSVKGFFHL